MSQINKKYLEDLLNQLVKEKIKKSLIDPKLKTDLFFKHKMGSNFANHDKMDQTYTRNDHNPGINSFSMLLSE